MKSPHLEGLGPQFEIGINKVKSSFSITLNFVIGYSVQLRLIGLGLLLLFIINCFLEFNLDVLEVYLKLYSFEYCFRMRLFICILKAPLLTHVESY